MLYRLIALFTLVPALELVIIIQLGRVIGFVPTLAMIAVLGVVGAALAKSQGLRVVRSIQADLAAGRVPAYGLVDGLIILLAGALLITPGLLTDTVGLLLLIPPVRNVVKNRARAAMERALRSGAIRVVPF